MSRVLVTFSAPLIFLSSDQWTQIRTAIADQSPLRDILWKPSSRPATRTIPELDIELVGLDTIRDEHTSQIPQTLLEKPFLNLYIVTCEDNDVYKNTVRKQIKDWHTTVSQRKNQEWLILLVVRPDARTNQGSFFALKSNVLDKIKADFNSDRKDRCVQLVWSQGAITPPASADLTTKMKDGIMSAFDCAVVQRSEEVKRSESQRQMPGWNFCTFFILKESLASSFVGMSLPDDAILTYSELEASFLQTQSSSLSGQKTISWFGKLINPDPKDDSLPLLDIRKKQYRDLILKNTISVFDFRVYLLAKHCEVLGMSGRVSEMARKAASFLGGFGQRLKESEVLLPEFFLESWIYSSALNVVDECEKWAELFDLDASSSASFNAVKGELLELARIQLDKIGISVFHLPRSPPFSMSLPTSTSLDSDPPSPTSSTAPTKSPLGQITRTDLLAGLTDREVFDKLYVDTTNRAIDMYIKGGRRKFALKLHGSLAALDLHRMRHAQAHQTYVSLPAHYMPHSWTSLATFMLGRRLETHALLEKPHNREWVDTMLSFLKVFVEETLHGELEAQQLLCKGDIREYVANLVKAVRERAGDLESGVVMTDHPMLSVEIACETAKHAATEDGSYVEVRVRNKLPCDIVVDKIRLFLSGSDTEQLEFTTLTQTFPPGSSTVTLFCPNPASGLFVLDVSEVSISSIKLQWNHQLPTRQKQPTMGRQRSSLVRIPRDPNAVDIQIEPPRLIQLDAPQSLLLTLRSGRNQIVRGAIKLSSPVGIDFRTKDGEVKESGDASVDCMQDHIKFMGMGRDCQIQIRVPHAYHAASDTLKVVVLLEYDTSEAEGSITRNARFMRHVTTSLPLMIQAHDHFRGKSLISKFTIATSPGTYQHLRICAVSLESVEDEQQGGLVVKGCRSEKRGVVTVTPTQSANFLFRIDSEVPRSGYASLHLHITYRLLREEVESLVESHASSALHALSLPQELTSHVTTHILKALEGDGTWLPRYNATRELRIQRNFLEDTTAVDGASADEMRATVDAVIESLGTNSSDGPKEGAWREVIVPVDLPFKNIVSAARIHIHPTSSTESQSESGLRSRYPSIFAGQPVAATLSISNSFHWSGPGAGKSYAMRFDVKEMSRDWLISGRKRGDFLAMDGSTHSVPLTLIPLHHGELSLPLVNVHPLPLTSGELTMGSMALPSAEAHQVHGAERILVLPRGGRTTFVVGMGGD